MIRKILGAKDPRLRQKSKPVVRIDKKIKQLAEDLVDTLKVQKEPEGVGLAAIQIGKPLRMFAMVHAKKIRVIINPKIIKIPSKPHSAPSTSLRASRGKGQILEGCLSIPNLYGPLKRPQRLTLQFLDLGGQQKTEVFTGFSAQIVQHEIDHLNGKLFVDKIIKQKKPLYNLNSKSGEWEDVEI